MKKTILLFAIISVLMEGLVILHASQAYPYEAIRQEVELIQSPAEIEAKISTMHDYKLSGETQIEINIIDDSRKFYNTIISPYKYKRDSSLWRRGAIKTMISGVIMLGQRDAYLVDEEFLELGNYRAYQYRKQDHSVNNQNDSFIFIIDQKDSVIGGDGNNYVWIFTTQSVNLNPVVLTPAYMQRYINCFLLSEAE